MRLYNQTAAESSNLFSILSSVHPPRARAHLFEHIIPFELFVIHARSKYWAGDPLAHLDELAMLLKMCKRKARSSELLEDQRQMWKERAARVGMIMASQLLEMQDYRGAETLLRALALNSTSPDVLSALARTRLEVGDLASAAQYFQRASALPSCSQSTRDLNSALLASARGEWTVAAGLLESVLAVTPDDVVAVNDFAVVLLNLGRLKDAIDHLESALKASPSTVVVSEPLVFNLATLYELRSATAAQKKRDLLIETAKWSGDGLRTTCLKLPAV